MMNETKLFNLEEKKNYMQLNKVQYKIIQITLAFMTVELTTTEAAKTLSEKSA